MGLSKVFALKVTDLLAGVPSKTFYCIENGYWPYIIELLRP